MGDVARAEILDFLRRLGERCLLSGTLYLLGGSALCMLGNPRRALDIDYMAESPASESAELRATIESLAVEMRLEIEAVALAEFLPLPADANTRHRLVGQFGKLMVYVYDPYSIALSKVARGFETDLQDVVFMPRQGVIALDQLEAHVAAILPHVAQFDIVPTEMRQHLTAVRRLL